MNIVLAYGGDVMKFAGDSVIVAFYATIDEATAPDQGLRSATMRCVRCAAELSDKCGELLYNRSSDNRPLQEPFQQLHVLRFGPCAVAARIRREHRCQAMHLVWVHLVWVLCT